MMTMELCVNAIQRHGHRKAAQTCHSYPAHFLLFILSLLHTFIEWMEDFYPRNFLMRLLIESHSGACHNESIRINFLHSFLTLHNLTSSVAAIIIILTFPANFSVVWNKCKRKEWKTGAPAFVSHFTLKKNGDDVMEKSKSSEQTLRETTSTENIIGK